MNGQRIGSARARAIASDWHGGQWSPLYMLASTGATQDGRYDPSDIIAEIRDNLFTLDNYPESVPDFTAEWHALNDLADYIDRVGPRGPVPGWNDGAAESLRRIMQTQHAWQERTSR